MRNPKKKVSWFFLLFLRFCRDFLHLHFYAGSSCRFDPSCFAYAQKTLETQGWMKSLYLISRRILRCHPFSGYSGYDPVSGLDRG